MLIGIVILCTDNGFSFSFLLKTKFKKPKKKKGWLKIPGFLIFHPFKKGKILLRQYKQLANLHYTHFRIILICNVALLVAFVFEVTLT